LVELMELAEGLAPLLTSSSKVNANPRLMKRFLNTVFLRSALAKPQRIELDLKALAKWHLLERCDEALANALAGRVTSATEGRVDAIRLAEQAAREGGALPEPFKDEFFHREWLGLAPALGEMDLRPLLHLSRDSAMRDFGDDSLTTEGRALRDALMVATSANEPLTQAIRAAGMSQADAVMAKVWQLKSPKRNWRQTEDVVPLLEISKIFPDLGAKAAALLAQAPIKEVGPGLVPLLYEQTWARPVLDQWHASGDASRPVKQAIEQARKGAR
jgi:predicted KAP-like P-loop ATPase